MVGCTSPYTAVMLLSSFIAYIAMSMNEEATSWVAAGDQVVFNISGVDISKIRLIFELTLVCLQCMYVHWFPKYLGLHDLFNRLVPNFL